MLLHKTLVKNMTGIYIDSSLSWSDISVVFKIISSEKLIPNQYYVIRNIYINITVLGQIF
jgi:hypothetical protein